MRDLFEMSSTIYFNSPSLRFSWIQFIIFGSKFEWPGPKVDLERFLSEVLSDLSTKPS